jgi:hypothetical protein
MTTDQANATRELSEDEVAVVIEDLMKAEPLPLVQKSIEAFRRDLPELLQTHRGQWVAYHGDERLGFGETETELYQRVFRRGLTRNDFVVGFVAPGAFDPDEEIEVASLHV